MNILGSEIVHIQSLIAIQTIYTFYHHTKNDRSSFNRRETFRAWVWNICHGFLQIFLVVHLVLSQYITVWFCVCPNIIIYTLQWPDTVDWLQMVEDWNTFKLTSISTEISPDLICIFWFGRTYGGGGMFSSTVITTKYQLVESWISSISLVQFCGSKILIGLVLHDGGMPCVFLY